MRFLLLLMSFLAVLVQPKTSLSADPPAPPDFTAGDKLPDNAAHDWNLGPTGARGWVHAWKGESTEARQILITAVAEGSPSAGVLKKDDVILGVADGLFAEDARIAFAKAITAVEAADGNLNLIRWRAGQRENVSIKLPVLGAYSATAPFHCEKSERILKQGCEAIAARMKHEAETGARRRHPIQHSLEALALLASGEKKYMPLIKAEADRAAAYEIDAGYHSWSSGWINFFLAEYVIATGDKSVLPGLERTALAIADGQSNVGTWGHRFAYEHNKILRGYGAMNQVGLSLTTSLILAREAGVAHPKVDEAIDKGSRFLAFYAGKGAIPYGDHHPWLQMHDDNGKASAAAVLFDLAGDSQPATFFTKLAISSFGIERETGHTGNYFNMLWALPGVSRSGPEATGAWIRESAWLLDLARRHDGTFDFLGKPGATGGEHSFRGWDCTGAYLVGYATALGNTRMTGSKPSVVARLNANEVNALIEGGRGWTPRSNAESYNAYSSDELLERLSSWSPVIRERSAIALAKKGADERIPERLLDLLNSSDDTNTAHGVCAAFEQLGERGAAGVDALRKLLEAEDLWLRVQAAEALGSIGGPAREAIPEMLKLAAAPPDPKMDPRGHIQRFVAFALFDGRGGLIGRDLEGVDRELLRETAEAILLNQDGRARGAISTIYATLKPEEIEPMLPAIYRAVVEQAPSGVMFSDGIRLAGLEVLAKNRIAEGLPECIRLIDLERWGGERRLDKCLRCLELYGDAAKSELQSIKAFGNELAMNPKYAIGDPKSRRHNPKILKAYQRIQKLISKLEEAEPSEPLRKLGGL